MRPAAAARKESRTDWMVSGQVSTACMSGPLSNRVSREEADMVMELRSSVLVWSWNVAGTAGWPATSKAWAHGVDGDAFHDLVAAHAVDLGLQVHPYADVDGQYL